MPLRPDERWRVGERGRRLSAVAVAILVGSLLLHGALVVVALLGAQADPVAPQEIPIEVVQEAPVPPKPAPAAPAPVAKPPEPVAAKPPPPPPQQPSQADTQRADLERQLAELKAEQQAMKAEEADAKSDADLGPLRKSIRAIALPGVGDGGDGDVVGYQELVFSQLAKAKGDARGAAKPAKVGVRFDVDDEGRLVDVAVAVSSGIASLDAESIAIVRRAAPFPKPPAGAERSFSANFAYAGEGR